MTPRRLGWYTHYNFNNYNDYGIDYSRGDITPGKGLSTAKDTLNRYKNNILSRALTLAPNMSKESISLQEWEDLINYFYTGAFQDDQAKIDGTVNTRVQNLFQAILETFIDKVIETSLSVDYETLEATNRYGNKMHVSMGRNLVDNSTRTKKDKHGETRSIEFLKKRMNSLIEILRTGADTEEEIQYREKIISEQIVPFIQTMEEEQRWYYEVYARGKTTYREYDDWKKTGHRSYTQNKNNKGVLVGFFNRAAALIKEFGTYPKNAAALDGIVGEGSALLLLNLMKETADYTAVEQVKEFIEKDGEKLLSSMRANYSKSGGLGWTAKTTPHYQLNEEKFTKKAWNVGDNNFGISANSSISSGQAKIDVNGQFINRDFRFSVKNITPYSSRGLHLETSNRTLLYHLQEDNAFLAHFMNLTGMSKDGENGDFGSGYVVMKQQYLDALRLKMIYNAMSGDGEGVVNNQVANIMFIHDKTTTRSGAGNSIRIIRISDIMRMLLNKMGSDLAFINRITGKGSGKTDYGILNDFHLDNVWRKAPNGGKSSKKARDRIDSMLVQLNKSGKIAINLTPETTIDILTM